MGEKGGSESSGFCTILLKFILFFMNCLVLIIGIVLATLGTYVQVEKTFTQLSVQSVLSNPAMILIIAGGILVILGVCGSIGALLEIYFLLILYALVLAVVALLQVAALGLLVVKKDVINQAVAKTFNIYILQYYNDLDTQNIVDAVQTTLQCCGSTGPTVSNQTTRLPDPHSWEANIYFNCSSRAYQKCSVPYSCCVPDSSNMSVINLQCGYGKLNAKLQSTYLVGIYPTGCVDAFAQLATEGTNSEYIIGAVSVIILVQVANATIAFFVAMGVKREKKAFELIRKAEKEAEKALAANTVKN